MIRDGFFTPGNEGEFKDVVDMLLYHDRFLTLADYKALLLLYYIILYILLYYIITTSPTSPARTW